MINFRVLKNKISRCMFAQEISVQKLIRYGDHCNSNLRSIIDMAVNMPGQVSANR